MTDGMMNLRARGEASRFRPFARDDWLAAGRLMELEVGGRHRGRLWREEPVAHGPVQRYRERDWETRAGCNAM